MEYEEVDRRTDRKTETRKKDRESSPDSSSDWTYQTLPRGHRSSSCDSPSPAHIAAPAPETPEPHEPPPQSKPERDERSRVLRKLLGKPWERVEDQWRLDGKAWDTLHEPTSLYIAAVMAPDFPIGTTWYQEHRDECDLFPDQLVWLNQRGYITKNPYFFNYMGQGRPPTFMDQALNVALAVMFVGAGLCFVWQVCVGLYNIPTWWRRKKAAMEAPILQPLQVRTLDNNRALTLESQPKYQPKNSVPESENYGTSWTREWGAPFAIVLPRDNPYAPIYRDSSYSGDDTDTTFTDTPPSSTRPHRVGHKSKSAFKDLITPRKVRKASIFTDYSSEGVPPCSPDSSAEDGSEEEAEEGDDDDEEKSQALSAADAADDQNQIQGITHPLDAEDTDEDEGKDSYDEEPIVGGGWAKGAGEKGAEEQAESNYDDAYEEEEYEKEEYDDDEGPTPQPTLRLIARRVRAQSQPSPRPRALKPSPPRPRPSRRIPAR